MHFTQAISWARRAAVPLPASRVFIADIPWNFSLTDHGCNIRLPIFGPVEGHASKNQGSQSSQNSIRGYVEKKGEYVINPTLRFWFSWRSIQFLQVIFIGASIWHSVHTRAGWMQEIVCNWAIADVWDSLRYKKWAIADCYVFLWMCCLNICGDTSGMKLLGISMLWSW